MVLWVFFFFFAFLPFSWAALAAYGGSQAGVESEPQSLAYARATATLDLSLVCDLHHSSWQRQILNPLSKVGDQTRILVDPSQDLPPPPRHNGNSSIRLS